MYRAQDKVIDINKYLKDVILKKFNPIMQHDSHEFMIYLLSSLADEETPLEGNKFDGSDEKKPFE